MRGEDLRFLIWPWHRPPQFSSRRLLTIDVNDPRLGHVLVGKAHAFAAETAVFESAKGHGIKAVVRGIIHHHPTRLDAAGCLQCQSEARGKNPGMKAEIDGIGLVNGLIETVERFQRHHWGEGFFAPKGGVMRDGFQHRRSVMRSFSLVAGQ